MLKGRNKAGARGVHPWHFIDKHYLPLVVGFGGKQVDEHVESLHPVAWVASMCRTITAEGRGERRQLGRQQVLAAQFHRRHSGMVEGKFVFEQFPHQESLAHSPSAIDCHELCAVATVNAQQFLLLTFPSYNFSHIGLEMKELCTAKYGRNFHSTKRLDGLFVHETLFWCFRGRISTH